MAGLDELTAFPGTRRGAIQHPARLITIAFAVAILVGALLLLLPAATEEPGGATFQQALFTATSAVTVTGLAVVDTPSHWSAFGEAVILVLIQFGGLGIMTLAIPAQYGVTVVCVKPRGGRFTYATADTVLGEGDVIVVAGETADAEAFAALD